jgi:hypothetical protein
VGWASRRQVRQGLATPDAVLLAGPDREGQAGIQHRAGPADGEGLSLEFRGVGEEWVVLGRDHVAAGGLITPALDRGHAARPPCGHATRGMSMTLGAVEAADGSRGQGRPQAAAEAAGGNHGEVRMPADLLPGRSGTEWNPKDPGALVTDYPCCSEGMWRDRMEHDGRALGLLITQSRGFKSLPRHQCERPGGRQPRVVLLPGRRPLGFCRGVLLPSRLYACIACCWNV